MGKQVLPLSVRAEQPRPEGQAYFGLQFLRVFSRFTRKEFAAAFGTQAPPFNFDATSIKLWWDSAAAELPPDEAYVYKYVDVSVSPPKMTTMVITNGEACSVNIPGRYDYPPYNIMPTRAFIQGPNGSSAGMIPADRLSYRTQAEEVYAKLRVDLPDVDWVIGEDKLDGVVFRYVYEINDPEEPENNFKEGRRLYNLSRKDNLSSQLNVGRTLKKMNSEGVGAPGHFSLRDGLVTWNSDTDLEDPGRTLPEVPIPCRDLKEDEEIVRTTPFDPGSIHIIDSGSGEVPGGEVLDKIWGLLKVIAERIGITVED